MAKADEAAAVITVEGLQDLLRAIRARGYRAIGPTLQNQAIVYDDIESIDDLPRGWTDEQDGGLYRLTRREDEALFGYSVGPQSWKKFLHEPRLRLWTAERRGEDTSVTPEAPPSDRLAFIGVRACEIRAIEIQDRVLVGDLYVDPHYKARREGALIVALNCGKAGGTCFCVSMHAGPRVKHGFDIALTELLDGTEHVFLVETGSDEGRAILEQIPHDLASSREVDAAEAVIAQTASSMGRQMRSDDLNELLMNNLEHPRWNEVATRCLTCANCTLVCPTCFCTSVEDASDLTGERAERWRRWDSCFTMDFSYIHGGSVRASTKSRYRQWMTHKLATWIDQFGSSGCVGCGRCITWCPVGIDITEEVCAIRGCDASAEESV
ncbi:4Fe-4S dicluster domain-containing protein [Methylocystis sp. B8]|uniref:4Fe-4S dicluster domain-containing protein n=1 Tax=Methylocystis sp. B8 TaxID=544938 RepID=UPI0010FF3D88|nr:4Fe-4S dicluster domain-containing protein [Methylocystis sp. B8]TLG75056.1 sulfite reductase subunit A [Methylocystis sp. B8]